MTDKGITESPGDLQNLVWIIGFLTALHLDAIVLEVFDSVFECKVLVYVDRH